MANPSIFSDSCLSVRPHSSRHAFAFMGKRSHIENHTSTKKFSMGGFTLDTKFGFILAMRNLEKAASQRIRELLKERGKSQRALAEYIGIEPGYLSELLSLHPDKRWNADHLEGAVSFFNIPSWQLFARPQEVVPKKYLDLMTAYESLDDLNRRIVDNALGVSVEIDAPRPPQQKARKETTAKTAKKN
jgi:transcriptional regulator with XRE-family HTH domain